MSSAFLKKFGKSKSAQKLSPPPYHEKLIDIRKDISIWLLEPIRASSRSKIFLALIKEKKNYHPSLVAVKIGATEKEYSNMEMVQKLSEDANIFCVKMIHVCKVPEPVCIYEKADKDCFTLIHDIMDDSWQNKVTIAREVFCQALAGLAFLQQHELVHRDIKPDNLLLFAAEEAEGKCKYRVKLADFEFCTHMTLESDTICGTGPYIDPHVFRKRDKGQKMLWSLSTDIYSLCVTAFEICCSCNFSSQPSETSLEAICSNNEKQRSFLTAKMNKEVIDSENFLFLSSCLKWLAPLSVRPTAKEILEHH